MPLPKRLVSRRLDRDPSQSIRAEKKRDLAAMMEIVLDNVPDNPLACQVKHLAIARFLEDVIEVGRRPAGERGLEHMPGDFEAVDQFCDASAGRGFFISGFQGQDNLCVAFAHALVNPADAGADNMGHVFANAATVTPW